MKRVAFSLAAISAMGLLSFGGKLTGQSPGTTDRREGGRQAARAEAAPAAGKTLTFDLVIADLAKAGRAKSAIDMAAEDKVAARIDELEAKGECESVSRIRLSTIDRLVTTARIGESRPVAVGRTSFPGGRDGRSFQMHETGTTVSLTPRIEDDGGVLVEITLETSRLAPSLVPRDRPDAPDAGVVPQRNLVSSVRSTVRLAPDTPTLIGRSQSGSADESRESLILLTVHAPQGAKPAAAGADRPADVLKMFSLQNAKAAELAKVVGKIFDRRPLRITADERTNSLLASGTPGELAEVEAVVTRLDEAPSPR
jgi:hypothetical protein